jgi:hypothetical protein
MMLLPGFLNQLLLSYQIYLIKLLCGDCLGGAHRQICRYMQPAHSARADIALNT